MRADDLHDLAARHAAPTPRYTSYPTAPHFNESVGADRAADWIRDLPDAAALSLYVHIPFCRALCWYCGCSTMVANGHGRVRGYLGALDREMVQVADLLGGPRRVTHLHWGGGSPNTLTPDEIVALAARMRALFTLDPEAEFAVEVDPRYMDAARARALAATGVNRVSIGVQDFDPEVQAAINRRQPFEMTRRVVAELREAGLKAINVDLVYGLPHQTPERLARTLDQALSLEPERVAVFGYAHLPAKIGRQRLIDETALPDAAARLGLAGMIAERLLRAGHVRIGLDHFARPSDPLARASVKRNFQGYTVDAADALIGFGASAISRLPQGYAQNAVSVADYEKRVARGGLATARGCALTDDDRMRAHVIERLMCDLRFSEADLDARFGPAARSLIEQARRLGDEDADGLIAPTPDGFRVTERGRPFVRSVCARFDAYFDPSVARHAQGV